MTTEIVRIESGNTHLLNRVAADVFDEPIHPGRLARLAQEQHQILLVAMSEGIVIGQLLAAVHRHPDKPTELYIDDLATKPTHQRQGIASTLVEKAVAIGREAGCEEIWVLTESDNEAANALYGSFGWRQSLAHMFETEF